MNRRSFIKHAIIAGLSASAVSVRAENSVRTDKSVKCGNFRVVPPQQEAKLNLCLQLPWVPGKEINEKLDYLEKNGYSCFEVKSGKWLLDETEHLKAALKGRNLKVTAACGPSDFSYKDAKRRDEEVEKFLPQLEALGELNAVGMILCPMRSRPGLGLKELRHDFVTNTGKRLAEKAAKCGTNIILEPLRHQETPFLRLVADGAAIARDIGKGATVMADFWHMSIEEPNFMGAIISGGKYLSHVQITSLRRRSVPGMDGAADNYIEGFRALKMIGYQGAIGYEGAIPRGMDAHFLYTRMSKLIREQWEMA